MGWLCVHKIKQEKKKEKRTKLHWNIKNVFEHKLFSRNEKGNEMVIMVTGSGYSFGGIRLAENIVQRSSTATNTGDQSPI